MSNCDFLGNRAGTMPVFVQEYMPGGAWTGVLETELVVFRVS
jgi:hypothetical protein